LLVRHAASTLSAARGLRQRARAGAVVRSGSAWTGGLERASTAAGRMSASSVAARVPASSVAARLSASSVAGRREGLLTGATVSPEKPRRNGAGLLGRPPGRFGT
jgi:hypothetical protein